IVGAGQTDEFGMTFGTGTTVTEAAETAFELQSLSCALEDGTPTGTASTTTRNVTGVEVQPGLVTTCTFTNIPIVPNIHITKTADDATVNSGGQVGFTVTISNTGNGAATGLSFTDDLPDGLSWSISPAAADPSWAINGSGDLVYNSTTLAAGATSAVHVIAT